MKNILLGILLSIACLPVFTVLGMVAFAGYTAYIWLPVVFDLSFGLSTVAGLVIGLCITIATIVVVEKIRDKLSNY